jgi:hypothetical protein
MGYTSLETINRAGQFARHKDFRGLITTREGSGEDFAFVLVPGLAGQGVSFQAANPKLSGHFLRHRNWEVWLDRPAPVDTSFNADATFHEVAGLADGNLTSYAAFGRPGFYLRHRDYQLWVEQENTPNLRPDATFKKVDARFRPDGVIGEKWRQLGGEGGPLGWATEIGAYDVRSVDEGGLNEGRSGVRRDFEGGQISWREASRLLVAGYRTDRLAVFEWGPTSPYNYDWFVARWSVAGGIPVPTNAQEDVPQNAPGRTRTTGFFHVPVPQGQIGSDGRVAGFTFVVEGHDGGLSPSSRQGWSCPIQCRL